MPAATPTPAAVPNDLLPALLDFSLAGIGCYAPVTDAVGQVIDFTFLYLNPAAQHLLGLPAQPAGTFGQQFPQAMRSGGFAFLRDAFTSGAAAEQVEQYQVAGQAVALRVAARRQQDYLLVSFAALPDEQLLRATFEREAEVREQAAYDEALRQREHLYRILEQAPAMICVFNGPQHIFQFVNSSYQALVGQRPLLGLTIAEAMPELAGQPIFGLLDRVYTTGETYYAHEMLVQLDHANEGPAELEKRYYNFIYQARRNAVGAVDGIFVFAYEVTAQVLARQQVQELNQQLAVANEQLQAANDVLEARVTERTRAVELAKLTAEQQRAQLDQLFMQAPAAICVLDGPDWVYRLVNPVYQRAFPGRALLGKPLLEALPELRDSSIPSIMAQVYTTGMPYQALELPVRLARFTDSPLEDTFWTFTYHPRHDAAGDVDGIMVFAYEVTEQVRARQAVEATQRQTQTLADELAQTNERLTRANNDLDSFVYTASHDLKAPIINIEGLLQALRQDLALTSTDAHLEPLLHLMQDSIGRFRRTIKYLTDVSRLQNAQPEQATPVVLTELLDGVCLDVSPLLAVSGGQITLAPDSCPTITFAEKNLRSIVYNLVSNALKYRSPERPPRVQVRCHTDATGAAVLEVQDNGLGLTNEQREKVFGMFQRLHDHVEGSGIGLFLVKKIVENAGGRITVVSRQGEGSTFQVVLPQGPAAAVAAAEPD
ncbi:PAS domain-containing protein [Hymenobacter sp. CRA2]|uniref:PAS domain-containing sensor histidine kinase n=1 Tax=Hymenobacter sp. CRA2 TaxID=1955620 RepID=UPI00098EB0C2|nr:PAS domain-containing protein [Hymenobacter sp. CRA2]OON70911.1 hypothetical protein B0919_02595 [Hymenobacter sp. CRA2]